MPCRKAHQRHVRTRLVGTFDQPDQHTLGQRQLLAMSHRPRAIEADTVQHARSCFALAEAQMRRFKPATALRRQRARPMYLRGGTATVRGMPG